MKLVGGKSAAIMAGGNTKKTAKQDGNGGIKSGPKKIESVSFDNRKQ